MKKLITVLLAAALLSFGAICAMAADSKPVSGEPSSVVIVDFLASLQDTDNESVTVKRNENGSVTLTFKKEATEGEPIHRHEEKRFLYQAFDGHVHRLGPARLRHGGQTVR